MTVTGLLDEIYFSLIKFVDLPFSTRYVPGGAMTTTSYWSAGEQHSHPIGQWTERPVFNRYFTFSLLERPAIWGPTIYFPPIHPPDNSGFNLGKCNSIHSEMKNLSTVEKIFDKI